MDISSPRHFSTCMFWPCTWTFLVQGLFGTGTFWHKEFLAPWIFRHLNILTHVYFGTLQSNMDVLAQTFWHLCYCTEMSMCRNAPCRNVPLLKIPHVENSPCRNVPVLKLPSAGTSKVPNGALAEMVPWWNIRAEMTIAKISGAEMVGSQKARLKMFFKVINRK